MRPPLPLQHLRPLRLQTAVAHELRGHTSAWCSRAPGGEHGRAVVPGRCSGAADARAGTGHRFWCGTDAAEGSREPASCRTPALNQVRPVWSQQQRRTRRLTAAGAAAAPPPHTLDTVKADVPLRAAPSRSEHMAALSRSAKTSCHHWPIGGEIQIIVMD